MTEEIMIGKHTKTQVDAFLEHALLARLSTAVPSKEDPRFAQPHTTAVWFVWEDSSLYISVFQSTRKAKEVKRNPYIAVLIDVAEAIGEVSAVLLEGKCELILDPTSVQEMSRRIYTKYMGEEGVLAPDPQSWIIDPENSIIRLTPKNIYTW
jgi:nitroimidazol reductase NimA-like FMN-containing flavoprotein (pyridoxamine 5'-phosphate oxidase superfamily)